VLALSFIRRHAAAVRAAAAAKGRALDLDRLLACAAERRRLLAANAAIGEPGVAVGAPAGVPCAELRRVDEELAALLAQVPNLPCPGVPLGDAPTGAAGVADAAAASAAAAPATEVRRWGEPPAFPFTPRPHWELGAAVGVDEAAATRAAGAGFVLLRGRAARLERALTALALDTFTARGWVEVSPPLLARADALFASAHLPAYAAGMYEAGEAGEADGAGEAGATSVAGHGLYLAPSPEAALLALARGPAIPAATLPLRYVACVPCFHAAAGAAGRRGRGLLRPHQFQAVHAIAVTAPSAAGAAFDELVRAAEEVLRRLELPYRVVVRPAGRLSFAAAFTWALEAWFPADAAYREVAACTGYGPFLARRAGIRFRPRPGRRTQLAHVVGSAGPLIGRLLAALLENGQRQDGSATLPRSLEAYCSGAATRPARDGG